MKIKFVPKYGMTEIDIPVNGGKLYQDNAPEGLSNLNGQVFTIINQIPKNETDSTKIAWVKHTLSNCGKSDGIYDKSTGTMSAKVNTWTAYIGDWQIYKPPHWLDDGYYSLSDEEKINYFTANVGDLVIFGDIPESAPTSLQEFIALTKKYKDMGGTISSAEAYINFKPNGTPWRTNHIELVKG